MGSAFLLPALAFFTMGAVIVLAIWSKKRTERLHHSNHPEGHSSLARPVADPNFKPDRSVTDPKHVTDAPTRTIR